MSVGHSIRASMLILKLSDVPPLPRYDGFLPQHLLLKLEDFLLLLVDCFLDNFFTIEIVLIVRGGHL